MYRNVSTFYHSVLSAFFFWLIKFNSDKISEGITLDIYIFLNYNYKLIYLGLPLSLMVGVRFAKHLARQHRKPIIPVHHMEAHALTVRLGNREKIQFPFLVLLIR